MPKGMFLKRGEESGETQEGGNVKGGREEAGGQKEGRSVAWRARSGSHGRKDGEMETRREGGMEGEWEDRGQVKSQTDRRE